MSGKIRMDRQKILNNFYNECTKDTRIESQQLYICRKK